MSETPNSAGSGGVDGGVSEGLSARDRARVIDAIRGAEARTAGEIYVIVARQADDHRLVPVLWAALFALLVPWPLYLLTLWPVSLILLIQAGVFIGGALALSHPAVRLRVVPGRMAAAATHRAARALFRSHGVHLTEARTGVLIYVALAERRVQVLADSGIHAKVADDAWAPLAAAVVAAARSGRLADGLVAAIGQAGEMLAAHFPRAPDDRNELPDRVVEI